MKKNQLKEISKKLYFHIKEEVALELINEHKNLLKKIDKLKKIDTTNINPMFRIDETYTSFMREDIPENKKFSKEIMIKNAFESDGDFIIIQKVVNND